MPLCYLLAGCPALVANLWDVTDRDIDKFSNALLDNWVDTDRPGRSSSDTQRARRSLAEELPVARGACKLRYLNGASPVCYGVPVHLGGQNGGGQNLRRSEFSRSRSALKELKNQ
jgi:separase